MKSLLPISVCAWISFGFSPETTWAALINGGFESATLTGWTVEHSYETSATGAFSRTAGTVGIMSSWGDRSDFSSARLPQDGDWFAALRTRTSANFTGDGIYNFSLSQTLQFSQGELLSGWSFFYNGDLVPQDSAWVRIFDADGDQIAAPWFEGFEVTNQSSVAPLTATDWTRWEWAVPDSGLYTIRLGMTTRGNNNGASFGFFDNLAVQAANPVPEPSCLALAAAGAILLAARRRKGN